MENFGLALISNPYHFKQFDVNTVHFLGFRMKFLLNLEQLLFARLITRYSVVPIRKRDIHGRLYTGVSFDGLWPPFLYE